VITALRSVRAAAVATGPPPRPTRARFDRRIRASQHAMGRPTGCSSGSARCAAIAASRSDVGRASLPAFTPCAAPLCYCRAGASAVLPCGCSVWHDEEGDHIEYCQAPSCSSTLHSRLRVHTLRGNDCLTSFCPLHIRSLDRYALEIPMRIKVLVAMQLAAAGGAAVGGPARLHAADGAVLPLAPHRRAGVHGGSPPPSGALGWSRACRRTLLSSLLTTGGNRESKCYVH